MNENLVLQKKNNKETMKRVMENKDLAEYIIVKPVTETFLKEKGITDKEERLDYYQLTRIIDYKDKDKKKCLLYNLNDLYLEKLILQLDTDDYSKQGAINELLQQKKIENTIYGRVFHFLNNYYIPLTKENIEYYNRIGLSKAYDLMMEFGEVDEDRKDSPISAFISHVKNNLKHRLYDEFKTTFANDDVSYEKLLESNIEGVVVSKDKQNTYSYKTLIYDLDQQAKERLTDKEYRTYELMKLELTEEEMGIIEGITQQGIHDRKKRIRKKLESPVL
ncbi:MAG: helix-turn-helix transcriptional regulator [Halanaerobiales bacterium]